MTRSSKPVYLAGQGHSDGGFHSMEVFESKEDAKQYAESLFEDDREWTIESDLMMDTETGDLYADGETEYYGFEREMKGFVKEKEVR